MDRNSYIRIVGNVDSLKELCLCACTVTGEHKETGLSVRTVRTSDKVNEIVLKLVDDVALGNCLCSPPLMRLVNGTGLVHALEDEVLVIILELLIDLSPDLQELGLDIIISVHEVTSVDPVLVVNVEDDVHIVLDTVVNDFLNTSHPLGIDVIVLVQMLEPCGRNADCVEALSLQSIEELLISLGAAP